MFPYVVTVEAIKKAVVVYRSERQRERWDGGMRAVFAQWKSGLTERPISGRKCLKTMTTSTSLIKDDTWCLSGGRSEEVLWKLGWPHFLLQWNHHRVTPAPRAPVGHKGTDWGFFLTPWLSLASANLCLKSNHQRDTLDWQKMRWRANPMKTDTLRSAPSSWTRQ